MPRRREYEFRAPIRAIRATQPRAILVLVSFAFASAMSGTARAQTSTAPVAAIELDRATIVALARRTAPDVRVATVRVRESEALHVGAGAWQTNPEIHAAAGPRWAPTPSANGTWFPDFSLSLVWPLDVTGVPSARVAFADAATREALAAADETTFVAAAEAVDLWTQAVGAAARVEMMRARATLDESLLTIAQGRRRAGTVGDGDVALATIVRAESEARVRVAEGELAALIEQLRARVGIGPEVRIEVRGALEVTEPLPLATLIAGLAARRDVVRAGEATTAMRSDLEVQRRLGSIVPRLTFIGGRENEYFAHAGLDVPLPVYQRNQLRVAVDEARVATSVVERVAVLARAEGELRSAYARYRAAVAAVNAFAAARSSIEDAEQLATRAYELGQNDLTHAVTVRREVALVRTADLDARIALARARVAVDRAAGRMP